MIEIFLRFVEAKIASFFIKKIWPRVRFIFLNSISVRCKKCILNEKAATIDSRTGLCQFCLASHMEFTSKINWPEKKQELNQLILQTLEAHSQAPFHGLVLFSGGKDSCYMLTRLKKEFPQMRLLCLAVDNTFMSPFAVRNINESIAREGQPLMWVRISRDLAREMFRFSLRRNIKDEPMGLLDYLDGELISDIARTLAHKLKIPMVFMGLSSEQVERILKLESFEHPYEKEFQARTHIRNISIEEIFVQDHRHWWWKGAEKSAPPARFIFPLATWNVSEEVIVSEVERSGLLKGAKLDPMLTNHDLILPMIITDYIRHGYFTYEPEFAEKIRSGRAKRQDWISLFEFLEYTSRTGKALPPLFDKTLKSLNLTRSELGIPGGL